MRVLKLDLRDFVANEDGFCLVDIRGKQSFLAAHLRASHHLSSQDDIVCFVVSQVPQKPLLLVCFSSVKAKKMCENLANDDEFLASYANDTIFYLDCGIMEAFDNGFEPFSDFAQPPHSNTPAEFVAKFHAKPTEFAKANNASKFSYCPNYTRFNQAVFSHQKSVGSYI